MVSLLLRATLAALLFWAASMTPAMTASAGTGIGPGDGLFTSPRLPRFSIEIAETNLVQLRFGGQEYVHATVRVEDVLYRDVGVRLKGRGSFRPVADKPSLALKFDEVHSRQHLFGLTKIMLNNASQDSTLLSEYLASGLFQEAGVPAARVTHARVTLNNRDLGFYVLVEAMNKVFLRRHFDNPYGNLYEGYARDIDQTLDEDNGPAGEQADRRALAAAAQSPLPDRWHRLNQVLDLDRFISFLGITLLSAQHDSYPLNRNNFRLYRDPDADRFVMIPHGIDGSFSRNNMSIQPPTTYLLTRAVLELPEGQERYRRRVGELFTNVFDLQRITNRVRDATERLTASAANESERIARREGANAMLRRVARRLQYVSDQLAGRTPAFLTFGADERATLTGWEPELGGGPVTASRERWENLETLSLRIESGTAVTGGSWRASVSLPAGRYRFTARARVSGTADSTTLPNTVGVAIRISGNNVTQRFSVNDRWEALEHRFTVREPGDIQLVCELRAAQGHAWFDLQSLQLIRDP